MSDGLRAGSAYSIYRINYSYFDQDAAHIERRYAELARMAERPLPAPRLPAAPSVPTSGSGDTSTAAAQRAAIAEQRLATEKQRTAQITAQSAIAEQRLATEQQRTAATASQAAIAEQRLATERIRGEQAALRLSQAQTKVAQATTASTRGMQVLPRTIAGLSHEAANAATQVLGIGSAVAIVSKGVELGQLGAQAKQTRQAFDGLAQQAGTTGDTILNALRKASAGTISDLNLQLAANKANLLGVADSAQELSVLMDIARDRAQKMGISTTQAFNDLVTGLGRGSALILDNLGITISVTEANKAYAAALGKTVSQLSDAEQKQALINAVLAQGQASIAATGGALDTTAGSFAQVGASADNAKAALGGLIAEMLRVPAGPVAQGLQWVANGLNQIATANDQLRTTAGVVAEGAASYEDYGRRVAFANEQLAPFGARLGILTSAQYDYARALIATGTGATEAAARAQEYAAVINTAASADKTWGEGQGQLLNQMMALATGTEYERAAVESLSAWYDAGAISGDTFRNSIALLSGEQTANAQAAALDRIETEQLSRTHQSAAQIAAAFGSQIQTLIGFTTQSAQQSILDSAAKEAHAAQLQNLTIAAERSTQSFLSLNPNIDQAGIALLVAAGKLSPFIGQLAALRLEAAQAANQVIQLNRTLGGGIGGSAKPLGRLERGGGGALSADAIGERIRNMDQTQRIYAHFASVETKARATSRATGAGHLSDMQRLNNSLAANQAGYADKTEDEARKHNDNLLKIDRDFQQKSLAQQGQNEESKRASRYSFYKSLADAGESLGEAEATAYSAAYETAFAESQALAQAGQHKLAADRLALRQQQIQQDIEAAKAIAEAEEAGNTKRAESLRQLEALRKDAQTEELKQLEGRGDQLVNDRQKAIDEEATRYQGAQEQNALAAERKADRAVTAAEREHKAIGDTNALLAQQQALYSGQRPAGAAAGPATTPPASIPAAGPPAGTAASASAFAVFDAAVVGAIQAQTTAIEQKFDALISRVGDVERAIGRIPSQRSVQ